MNKLNEGERTGFHGIGRNVPLRKIEHHEQLSEEECIVYYK